VRADPTLGSALVQLRGALATARHGVQALAAAKREVDEDLAELQVGPSTGGMGRGLLSL
jgi:hypothetical protein